MSYFGRYRLAWLHFSFWSRVQGQHKHRDHLVSLLADREPAQKGPARVLSHQRALPGQERSPRSPQISPRARSVLLRSMWPWCPFRSGLGQHRALGKVPSSSLLWSPVLSSAGCPGCRDTPELAWSEPPEVWGQQTPALPLRRLHHCPAHLGRGSHSLVPSPCPAPLNPLRPWQGLSGISLQVSTPAPAAPCTWPC